MRTTALSLRLLACLLAVAAAWSADQAATTASVGGPVSTATLIAPLSLEDAQRFTVYTQILTVRERDGVLFDTAEARNQTLLVQSVSYFAGANGQLYAIVAYLRPRQPAVPSR